MSFSDEQSRVFDAHNQEIRLAWRAPRAHTLITTFAAKPIAHDCTQFSGVCLVFDKESCLVNDDASLTEEACKDKNDENSGFVGGTAQWCPEA